MGTASGVGSNLYNLANGQSQNAMNSSNAINGFSNQQYGTQASMYNTDIQADAQKQAAMYAAMAQVSSSAMESASSFI